MLSYCTLVYGTSIQCVGDPPVSCRRLRVTPTMSDHSPMAFGQSGPTVSGHGIFHLAYALYL